MALLRHIIRTFISDISGEFFLSHKKERINMIDDKYGLFEKKKKKKKMAQMTLNGFCGSYGVSKSSK
ncbi:hypothetical protein BsIDN1_16550 [Bacillus safensis]|uniref:Uncharacterized protein n=1 Tax=Bacillus safensis TaxID=561879 RepID=A0A5S9M369_BACIA|nr:hypothetical protein BsIDN1_16550 [Bacillus safensis]